VEGLEIRKTDYLILNCW